MYEQIFEEMIFGGEWPIEVSTDQDFLKDFWETHFENFPKNRIQQIIRECENYVIRNVEGEIMGAMALKDAGRYKQVVVFAVKLEFRSIGVGSNFLRRISHLFPQLVLFADKKATKFYKKLGFVVSKLLHRKIYRDLFSTNACQLYSFGISMEEIKKIR